MIDFTTFLTEMKSGKELISELTMLPEYDPNICQKTQNERLVALSDLFQIYIPSSMSIEIYSKLYLALLRSMQKKSQQIAIKQRNENHKAILQKSYSGVLGGADSFTIIGASGIGKSSAISRAISLITKDQVIEVSYPFTKIIPCLVVQCPFDSSVKGLLLEILRQVDDKLGTNYYRDAIKSRNTTTDVLIGSVSNIALNHIGMLIVDEIQNVVNSKNGKNLIGSLTQLINNSGISICMVGTPECTKFFEQAMQLARRSVGLCYTTIPYDEYFQTFCKILFQYQYVHQRTEINDALIYWLFEHSSGILSVVISLIHDAQEIAILDGRETLDIHTLNEAFRQRLSMLRNYISPSKNASLSKKKKTQQYIRKNDSLSIQKDDQWSIAMIVEKAKSQNVNPVSLLRNVCPILEVRI